MVRFQDWEWYLQKEALAGQNVLNLVETDVKQLLSGQAVLLDGARRAGSLPHRQCT